MISHILRLQSQITVIAYLFTSIKFNIVITTGLQHSKTSLLLIGVFKYWNFKLLISQCNKSKSQSSIIIVVDKYITCKV